MIFEIMPDHTIIHTPSGEIFMHCNSRKCAKNVIEIAMHELKYDWSLVDPLGENPDWKFHERLKAASGMPETRTAALTRSISEARNG